MEFQKMKLDNLPKEILIEIFSYSTFQSLQSTFQFLTCKYFHIIYKSPYLHFLLFKNYFKKPIHSQLELELEPITNDDDDEGLLPEITEEEIIKNENENENEELRITKRMKRIIDQVYKFNENIKYEKILREMMIRKYDKLKIEMKVVKVNDEEYGSSWGTGNLFRENGVYCSATKGKNLNIICESNEVVIIKGVIVKVPGWGFTSPIVNCCMFCCNDEPKIDDFKEFNDLSYTDYMDRKEKFNGKEENEGFPFVYVQFPKDRSVKTRKVILDNCVVGKYGLIKVIEALLPNVNTDIKHVEFLGIKLPDISDYPSSFIIKE